MAGVRLRLVPFGVAAGPENMAADEALLGSAVAGVASLRFYGWSEPTVSLGYFQPEAVRRADPAVARLPVVRRPSGGATLVHDRELTYALALPAGPPWQPAEAAGPFWLRRMHGVIARALRTLGVPAREVDTPEEKPGFLCFRRLTPGDLVIGSDKVVGSAQRRQRGALVQHGAVLLAASPSAPVLPGIRELAGRALDIADVREAVAAQLGRETGWEIVPGDWDADERGRTAALARDKYTRAEWNLRR